MEVGELLEVTCMFVWVNGKNILTGVFDMDSEKRKKILKNTIDIFLLIRKGYEQKEVSKSCYEDIKECTKSVLDILNEEVDLEKLENNN